MKIQIAQVVGLNTDQEAAQVISSQREDNLFVAVLDLACDDAFAKGRQILSELADFYFDFEGEEKDPVNPSSSSAERLKATFDEAQKKFERDFSIIVAAISGKILYFISQGEVEVYLKRLDKLSPLSVVGAQNQLISGFLQQGDRLLFSTASLTKLLAEDLSKSLDLGKETFEEEITMRIGGSELENDGLAALMVEVNLAEAPEDERETEESAQIPNLQEDAHMGQSGPDSNLVSTPKQVLTIFLKFLWQQKKLLPKSGKSRLLIAVFLIVVIALGVGFKVKAAKDVQKQVQFSQALQGAKDDFNAAKGLATLNPAEAKSKLDSSKDKLSRALSLKPNDAAAQNFKKQIEAESASILLQSSVSDFPQFLDMDLIKKNFRASQMSLSNGKLLLLDPAVKTLVVVDLNKKSNQILAGLEQLGEAIPASLNGGLAFVFSKDKGVLRVDTTNQKITSVAKKDSDLGEIKDLYGFGGNVYLLDIGKNMIWKYLATADGYSDKREYLNKNTKADFASAIRMQIESSIYVLKKDGEMFRFTRGDKDNFSYGGLDKGVKDPKSFFVSSDTDNLYLLDSGNSRLLILTKTGSYKGQINGEKFAQASDLVVDEKAKKVYLLDGSKIFQVDLK